MSTIMSILWLNQKFDTKPKQNSGLFESNSNIEPSVNYKMWAMTNFGNMLYLDYVLYMAV
jgi:hypothetical protein